MKVGDRAVAEYTGHANDRKARIFMAENCVGQQDVSAGMRLGRY